MAAEKMEERIKSQGIQAASKNWETRDMDSPLNPASKRNTACQHLDFRLLTSKRSVFIPIPNEGNAQECSNYRTIALISHVSEVILKILHARLQQYMNQELPDVQIGFRKGRGTRDQIANIHWIIKKAREFQKNICFIDYAKRFDCVNHKKMWKILKEMEILDHLTCFQENLYAGQEATVRTGHRTMDRFPIGKGVCQGCILSPCLLISRVHHVKCQAG